MSLFNNKRSIGLSYETNRQTDRPTCSNDHLANFGAKWPLTACHEAHWLLTSLFLFLFLAVKCVNRSPVSWPSPIKHKRRICASFIKAKFASQRIWDQRRQEPFVESWTATKPVRSQPSNKPEREHGHRESLLSRRKLVFELPPSGLKINLRFES